MIVQIGVISTVITLLINLLNISFILKKIEKGQKAKYYKDLEIDNAVRLTKELTLNINDIKKDIEEINRRIEAHDESLAVLIKDRKVMFSAMYTILENMKKDGSNGNTDKTMQKINEHLINSLN